MRKNIGTLLMVVCGLAFLGIHIYFGVQAFHLYSSKYAWTVILWPIAGPARFCGRSIAHGDWIPLLMVLSAGIIGVIGVCLRKET